MVPDIWSMTEYFVVLAIFWPLKPLTDQKIKILKNEKNARGYRHFTHVQQKLRSHDVRFLRYGAQRTDAQTDGQTDGQKK